MGKPSRVIPAELLRRSLAVLLLAAVACASATPQRAPERPLFAFQSNFWVNLHHFARAAARGMPAPGELSAAERSTWDAGVAFYRETSTVAGVELDAVSRTKASGLAFVGAEYGRGRVRFGLEASYALVPKTLDAGGVGAVYNESDAGGLAAMGRVVFVL